MMALATAAFWVWLKILLPGWAWIWILPERLIDDPDRAKRWVFTGAGAALCGLISTALIALALGEAGWFTPVGERIARGAFVFAGLALGIGWRRGHLMARWRAAAPAALLLLIGFATALSLPRRGEWLPGGLDPGVYLNEAAALSRTGSFYPSDAFFFDALTAGEREALTRSGQGRTERFPAVVAHPGKKAFTFEFFRLTPALFASIHRSADMGGLTRANLFVALLAILVFAALVLKQSGHRSHAIASALVLAMQPIFLYHTHQPTTEILQLFILCSFFFLALHRPADAVTTGLAGLCLLAATLNRHAFLPFAGLLLIVLSVAESGEADRAALVRRRLYFAAICLAGSLINGQIAPVSMRGWSDIRLINAAAVGATGIALAADLFFSIPAIRKWRGMLPDRWLDALAGTLIAAMGVLWLARSAWVTPQNLDNLERVLPFTGRSPLIAAGAGFIWLLFQRPRKSTLPLLPLFLFFLGISYLLIFKKSITDLYPWATRRYLPYLVPFIALSAGHLLVVLWNLPRWRGGGRALAAITLLAILLEPAAAARRAWKYTSYDGIAAALEAVAAQVAPDDLVVADHPTWGTPMALLHGFDTLNGREIWKEPGSGRMAVIGPALNRESAAGRRIRFLTSTSSGMDIYPFPPGSARLDWTGPEIAYQEIIQHPRADQFELRTRSTTFRLWTLACDL